MVEFAEQHEGRVIVASNRLSTKAHREKKGGKWIIEESPGGLVTAMETVLNGGKRRDLWVGWGETSEKEGVEVLRTHAGSKTDLAPVHITNLEKKRYYDSFSNGLLWFWFHGLLDKADWDCQTYYNDYLKINNRFAQTIKEHAQPDDVIWTHDYHLIGAARLLHDTGLQNKAGFFLHIPWPSVQTFTHQNIEKSEGVQQDIRKNILMDMTYFKLVRFQTKCDKDNFISCVREDLRDEAKVVKRDGSTFVEVLEDKKVIRSVKVDSLPINIDPDLFQRQAQSDKVLEGVRKFQRTYYGVNMMTLARRDPTKALPEGLDGLELFLRESSDVDDFQYHLVAQESRKGIPVYDRLTKLLDQRVRSINNEFRGKFGREVIVYNSKGIKRTRTLILYGGSQIGLIIPHRDGYNLIGGSEYPIAGPDYGALILSRGAGAIERLGNVMPEELIVSDPRNKEEVAGAILAAYKMPKDVREAHMRDLRTAIYKLPVGLWAKDFINTLKAL